MSFDVAADSYDRFMGRYSSPLSPGFADFACIERGHCVLDVGCGTGVLTTELVRRVGTSNVVGADPSPPFVAAMAERHPEVEVHGAVAEALPFADETYDRAVAQLVVHFMRDPVAGLREMARVTRAGGIVAACVWDYGGGTDPLAIFWRAARELDLQIVDESHLAGAREGHLAELFDAAGLEGIEEAALDIVVEHSTFDEWWHPYTLGVGPAGAYVASLDRDRTAELRRRCEAIVSAGGLRVTARAWAARATVTA